jgi:hypothetical protein
VSLDQYGSLTSTVMTSTSEKDQGVTPKASMSYQFTKDLMVYATAAKGFRPGGGTGPVPTSGPLSCETQLQQEYGSTSFVNGPISFKSDNVWSYEVGEKLRLADNRMTLNASLYFEKWSGVQQTNALSSCGYVYTAIRGRRACARRRARDRGHRGARPHRVGKCRVRACSAGETPPSSTRGSVRERRFKMCRSGPRPLPSLIGTV